jgi:RNA polymerase sigma factor (sigma-70 family)
MNRLRTRFWQLVEPEHQKARAFCRKLTGDRDEGDDLYQDALVSALTGFEKLKDEHAFRPWLYRIIINCFKNRRREAWWRRVIPLNDDISRSLIGKNPGPAYAARRRLEKAYEALSTADRVLVTLFELEGWRISEIAELTGKSEGSLKVRLSRARRKMRETLRREMNESALQNLKSIWSEDEICVVTKPVEE